MKPANIITTILVSLNIIIFFISVLLLPMFWALVPLFILSLATTVILRRIYIDKGHCDQIRQQEYECNSIFVDEILKENDQYRYKVLELGEEKEFLITVLENYGVKKMN